MNYEFWERNFVQTRSNGPSFNVLSVVLDVFLTTLGKSNAMFRARLGESTSNKFANLATTVGPVPVMSFMQWCNSA